MTTLNEFLQGFECTTVTAIPAGSELTASDCHVFIGCDQTGMPGLILNNKTRRYDSVTGMLLDPPPDLFEGFLPQSERPLAPGEVLQRVTLVVEDASPDSVFGFFLALARLSGVATSDIPRGWINAVRHWETTGNCGIPEQSWCALETALVHSLFPADKGVDGATYSVAWTEALRFLVICMKRDLDPDQIPEMPNVREWESASVALRGDRQSYLDWLPHARVVQLSLPRLYGKDRRTLVDALIVVEDEPAGAARYFYRNDREHSPMGEGFAFAAHYRPGADPGDDITITVDPRSGTHLEELWAALEQRETEAWATAGKQRPKDCPRRMESAPSNPYNQPWYLKPERTLIAAPRIRSMLSWAEVCETIWATLNPLNRVKVSLSDGGALLPIQDLSAHGEPTGEKTLLFAYWPRGQEKVEGKAIRGLSDAPVVMRSLASLVDHEGTGSHSFDELPVGLSFTKVELRGGFAIVTSKGVFVLDDWREQKLADQDIREAVIGAAELDEALRALNAETGRLARLVNAVDSLLEGKKTSINRERALRKAARIRATLAGLRGNHAVPPNDADARTLREALNARWGIDKRLDAAEKEVAALDSSLRLLVDLRTSRIGRWIGLYGFPVFVATGLGQPVARWVCQSTQANAPSEPTAQMVLATMGLVAVVLWGVVALGTWLEDPLRQRFLSCQKGQDD